MLSLEIKLMFIESNALPQISKTQNSQYFGYESKFQKMKKVSSKVLKWDFSSKFGKNWMKKVAFVTNGLNVGCTIGLNCWRVDTF
jgi:hypothetical protein